MICGAAFGTLRSYIVRSYIVRSLAKAIIYNSSRFLHNEVPSNVTVPIKWKSYISPYTGKSLKIAEAADCDKVFDDAINNNLPEPFGIVTWGSSFIAADVLDEKIASSNLSLKGKRVVDLGSGTGLASVLCYSYGATVIALDINPVSLVLCEQTYRAFTNDNPTHSESNMTFGISPAGVEFLRFDMECEESEVPFCDLLILSDVTYYASLAMAAAGKVRKAVLRYNCEVLITDPGRPTAEVLVAELNKLFAVECDLQFRPYVKNVKQQGQYLWIDVK